MKKVILAVLVMGLLLGGISLGAQEKKVAMSLNLGAMTYVGSEGDSFSDFLFSLGAQVDWRLGSSFMLSPEVQVLTYRFHSTMSSSIPAWFLITPRRASSPVRASFSRYWWERVKPGPGSSVPSST